MSFLNEIDDEILDEAADGLYTDLNEYVMAGSPIRPYVDTAPKTKELYRTLALTVIEVLRRNYE